MAKIVIRRAVSDDIVRIKRLLQENKTPLIRVGRTDENKAYQFALALIQMGYVAVADLNGNIVGTIGCAAFPAPASNDIVLNGEWLYVQPKYRSDGLATALIRAALRYARKMNAELALRISIQDHEDFGKELHAFGMKEAGRTLILGRNADGSITPEPTAPVDQGPPPAQSAAPSKPARKAGKPPAEPKPPIESTAEPVEEVSDPDGLLDE